jgi:hypothetical protein
MQYTPEIINELAQNEIFVFGTNQYAKHGGGAALIASRKFGAIYGECPIGLVGNTYGIITTSFNEASVSLEFIRSQVETLYYFALLRPDLTFLVTKIGTGIAGFSIDEIKSVFRLPFKPKNIILPIEF